jgi:hypothetical protein
MKGSNLRLFKTLYEPCSDMTLKMEVLLHGRHSHIKEPSLLKALSIGLNLQSFFDNGVTVALILEVKHCKCDAVE